MIFTADVLVDENLLVFFVPLKAVLSKILRVLKPIFEQSDKQKFIRM
jgi:hypothetical protein